jgi:hypothetical protein
MYYYLYKTTNMTNGKYYYGRHSHKSLNNTYIGSGTIFLKAVRKYGKDCVRKEILSIYDTHEEAVNAERLLVDETIVNDPMSYNLIEGGTGISVETHPSRNGTHAPMLGKKHSESSKQKMRKARARQVFSEETKRKIGKSRTGIYHTEETKKQMSVSHTGLRFSNEHKRNLSESIKRSWEKRRLSKPTHV